MRKLFVAASLAAGLTLAAGRAEAQAAGAVAGTMAKAGLCGEMCIEMYRGPEVAGYGCVNVLGGGFASCVATVEGCAAIPCWLAYIRSGLSEDAVVGRSCDGAEVASPGGGGLSA